ncbi:MAG: hypothetical protein NVSMB9_02590 [Isosphaeraceae bacterium]
MTLNMVTNSEPRPPMRAWGFLTCRPTRWTWGTLTALAVAVCAALSGGREPTRAIAQAQVAPRVSHASEARRPYTYRQVRVLWHRMDESLTEWEAKGWETFQIVPIANPNPASGTEMQVALVFRRPARAGQ